MNLRFLTPYAPFVPFRLRGEQSPRTTRPFVDSLGRLLATKARRRLILYDRTSDRMTQDETGQIAIQMLLDKTRLPHTVRQLVAATAAVALLIALIQNIDKSLTLRSIYFNNLSDFYYSKTINGRSQGTGCHILLKDGKQRSRDEWYQKMEKIRLRIHASLVASPH